MDKMKIKYQQAKVKVKDLLGPPSRQSAPLTTPAQSARNSQGPAATHHQVISATPSAVGLESQAGFAPSAKTTPNADILVLETSAPELSPRPEHTPNYAATHSEPGEKTQGEEQGAFEAEELKVQPENAITAGWSRLWLWSCTIIAYTFQASKNGSHPRRALPIRLATSTPSSATGQSSTIRPWSITLSRALMIRLVARFEQADNILTHSTGEGPREDYSWYDAILS